MSFKQQTPQEVVAECRSLSDAAVALCNCLRTWCDETGPMHLWEVDRARDLFQAAGCLILTAAALINPDAKKTQQECLTQWLSEEESA